MPRANSKQSREPSPASPRLRATDCPERPSPLLRQPPSRSNGPHRETRIGGINDIAHRARVPVAGSMQPGPDQQMLFTLRLRTSVMLAADVTLDRAHIHEVVPTSESEA